MIFVIIKLQRFVIPVKLDVVVNSISLYGTTVKQKIKI